MLATGAERDRRDKKRWNTTRGVLSVTGMKFMNWNLNLGGGGAIDLVIHLNNVGFKEAVQWLMDNFAYSIVQEQACSKSLLTFETNLKLPFKDAGKLPRVVRYLLKERGLTHSLIRPLVRSGKLYADNRGNAVFLLLGKEKKAVGAELRGTTQSHWRGMAAGSRKNLGYFSITESNNAKIILCESAIDAISCLAIYPHCTCISTSGARSNPLWLTALIKEGYDIYCGFDSDSTGDNLARTMISLYPTVKRLRPTLHDWNDVLKSQS